MHLHVSGVVSLSYYLVFRVRFSNKIGDIGIDDRAQRNFQRGAFKRKHNCNSRTII